MNLSRKFIVLFIIALTVWVDLIHAQTPCGGAGNSSLLPSKCFEIESLLVNACTSTEGYDEMVRVRLGPSPIQLSSINLVSWPTGNAWQGWATFSSTNLSKLTTINNSIIAAGNCGRVIKLDPTDVIPAYGRLLIITSTLFNATAHDFSGLADTLFVALQNNTTVTKGHFANTTDNSERTFILGTSSCSDTVSHYGNLMVKANGTFGSEDGSGVSFTYNGVATYFNYGCKLPATPFVVDAGTANAYQCKGAAVPLAGYVSGTSCFYWHTDNKLAGNFTDTTSLYTRFNLDPAYTGPVRLYLSGFGNCSSRLMDSVLFIVLPPLDPIHASISTDSVLCNKISVALSVVSGSTNTLTWSTTGSGLLSPLTGANTSFSPSPNDTGLVWFKVSQTSYCNTVKDSVSVRFMKAADARFYPDDTSFCFGSLASINLNPIMPSGTFTGQGIVGSVFTPIAPGNYPIRYYVETAGCSDSLNLVIHVLPVPDASFTVSDSALCLGVKDITFQPLTSGGVYYGAPVINDSFTPTAQGSYNISYVVNNGVCKDSVTHLVRVGNKPDTGFEFSDSVLCIYDAKADLIPNVQGGVFSGLQVQGNAVIPGTPGVYSVTYTLNNSGCVDSSVLTLRVVPQPVADFTIDSVPAWVRKDIGFTFTGSLASRFYWDFGDGKSSSDKNPIHVYSNDNYYTISLIAESDEGCLDTFSKVLIVEAEEHLFVPNAFTPNNDLLNDNFMVVYSGVHNYMIRIYNRWGILVYSSNNPDEGWDGKTDGRYCTEDVYFYMIAYTNLRGNERSLNGTVTLLR